MRDLESRGVSQSVNIYTIDITGLVIMSYKGQELDNLRQHMGSPPVFGVASAGFTIMIRYT